MATGQEVPGAAAAPEAAEAAAAPETEVAGAAAVQEAEIAGAGAAANVGAAVPPPSGDGNRLKPPLASSQRAVVE